MSTGHPILGSPFYSYEFCAAVDAVRGGVAVARFVGENGTVGYLPFQLRPGLAGTMGLAEKVGAEMSDYSGIISEDQFRIDPMDLLEQAGLNALRIDHLPADLGRFEPPDAEGSKGLTLDIGVSGKQYFEQLLSIDKNFVKGIERGGRQLERDFGPLRFEWNVATDDGEIERVIGEKTKQYARTSAHNPFSQEWARNLLFRLAQSTAPQCGLVLSTLFAGPTWVASHLGLAGGQILHSWFPVYNEELRRFSPGHVLMAKIIERAADWGIRFIDFGQGDSSYKRKYRPAEYVVLKCALRRRNPIGFLDRCWQSVEWRVHQYRRQRENPSGSNKASD